MKDFYLTIERIDGGAKISDGLRGLDEKSQEEIKKYTAEIFDRYEVLQQISFYLQEEKKELGQSEISHFHAWFDVTLNGKKISCAQEKQESYSISGVLTMAGGVIHKKLQEKI